MPIAFTRQEMSAPIEGLVIQYRTRAPDGHLGEISASAKLIAIQGTIVIDGENDMQTVVNTLLKCIVHQKHLSRSQLSLEGVTALSEEEVTKAVANAQKKKAPSAP